MDATQTLIASLAAERLIARLYDALDAHQPEKLRDLFAADGVWHRQKSRARGTPMTNASAPEFPPPRLDAWKRSADRVSPGESADNLVWQTPEGIAVKALYTAADVAGLPHTDTLPGFEPFVRGP